MECLDYVNLWAPKVIIDFFEDIIVSKAMTVALKNHEE